eukprot:CCRYP_018367-RA/>CCRYP_018367-RA protein AED:0.00 eAED:0.00 QI:84/-1/1/1/-1/0/1/195/399
MRSLQPIVLWFHACSCIRHIALGAADESTLESTAVTNTCSTSELSSSCNGGEDTGRVILDNDDSEENLSSWEFMNAFKQLGSSWSHVISEYVSVVNNADGKELRGDIYAENGLEEGLKLIKQLVTEAAEISSENELIWSFRTSPLSDLGKTVDDLLLAFLRWSIVDNQLTNGHSRDDNGCSLIGGINHFPPKPHKINVSKAFRRLTSYTQWMESVSQDLLGEPLTYRSISPSLSTFSIHVTHDDCGRLVWWLNLGKTQKFQSASETTRMFVWVAHLLFLDNAAQTKGLVVIDDMSEIGFWDYMTLLPLNVGISVDRFLISVTPLKAKNVALMHRPKWAEIAYGLLSWFLTERMKSRVTMVEKGEEEAALNNVVGGSAFIPVGFGAVKGEIEKDIISQYR